MVINMKKIFAIVVSLLFLVSVLGVASTMAENGTHFEMPGYYLVKENYYTISTNAPKVGQTFTIMLAPVALDDVKIQGMTVTQITNGIVVNGGLPFKIGPVELIAVDYYDVNGLYYSGLVLPGGANVPGFVDWDDIPQSFSNVKWIKYTFRAVSPGTLNLTNPTCNDTETVTILSKDLPFKFFAKLFGFGKKD